MATLRPTIRVDLDSAIPIYRQIVDSIRAGWKNKSLTNREFYAAGTWGPVASDDLLAQSGHAWHEPLPAP